MGYTSEAVNKEVPKQSRHSHGVCNLWILIFIAFIFFNIIAYFVPKKISKIEIYATCFFAYAYGITTDIIFDLHLHLYGYFQNGFQWVGLLGIILYFPAISFLFLNHYPSEKKVTQKWFYIFLWSLFAVIFEWLSVKAGYFYYNGWKLWYSGALYPPIFLSLVVNHKLVKGLIKRFQNSF